MEIVAGVQICEAGRTKKGPNRVRDSIKILYLLDVLKFYLIHNGDYITL